MRAYKKNNYGDENRARRQRTLATRPAAHDPDLSKLATGLFPLENGRENVLGKLKPVIV